MTKVTATKRIITVPEMIKAIKEHYNLNDTLLAVNLNVTNQTVKAWKEGKKPRKDSYLALTELYEGICEEIHQETTEEVEEVTEEKKPYEISYPKSDKNVYFLSRVSNSIIEHVFDATNESDQYLYKTRQCFDTQEEAKQFLKEQTLIKKIKCWAKEQQGDWEWESGLLKYSCCIILRNNPRNEKGVSLDVAGNDYFNPCSKLPYFKSQEIAQACIDEFGDEILEVFC